MDDYRSMIVCDLFYEPCVAQEQTFETATGKYQIDLILYSYEGFT